MIRKDDDTVCMMDLHDMHARHTERVADWLRVDEHPLNTGSGQSLQLAKMQGSARGAGEGVLVLTTQRLIFRDDATDYGIAVPREEVQNTKASRVPIPGLRSVKISTRRGELEFYVGKVFAKEILAALSRRSDTPRRRRIDWPGLVTALLVGVAMFLTMAVLVQDIQLSVSEPVFYAYVVAVFVVPVLVGRLLYKLFGALR